MHVFFTAKDKAFHGFSPKQDLDTADLDGINWEKQI